MDGLREWLSDNLRYLLLGLIIVILLVAIIFAIRKIANVETNGDNSVTSVDTTIPENSSVVSDSSNSSKDSSDDSTTDKNSTKDSSKDSAKDTTADKSLQLNAYPKVTFLIKDYYDALAKKDVPAIRKTIDTLSDEEADKIKKSQYIEGYNDVEVYTKAGVEPDSYVTYACYKFVFKDIDTNMPGLSTMYVKKTGDGSLKIISSPNKEELDLMKDYESSDDVVDLLDRVSGEYNTAITSDEALKNFLAEIGVDTNDAISTSAGSVRAKDECNVRSQPDSDSEIVGTLSAGQTAKKLSVNGEWILIKLNDQEGYVRADLVEIVSDSDSGVDAQTSENPAKTSDNEDSADSADSDSSKDSSE